MDEDKTVTITYETLFEILRREKDKLELQKLDDSFFADVLSYLRDKHKILQGGQQELFTEEEKIKTEKQLANLKKIIRELYERREKKILQIALDKSKTKSDLIDMSSLLKHEVEFFNSLYKLFDNYRENILFKLLNFEEPITKPVGVEQNGDKSKLDLEQPAEEKSVVKEKPTKLLRFKHAVPKFVGLDGEEFGPFGEEDMASLPSEIASVLITKGRAEEIEEE